MLKLGPQLGFGFGFDSGLGSGPRVQILWGVVWLFFWGEGGGVKVQVGLFFFFGGGCTSMLRPVAQDISLYIHSLWRCSSGSSTCRGYKKDRAAPYSSSREQETSAAAKPHCISTSDPTFPGRLLTDRHLDDSLLW